MSGNPCAGEGTQTHPGVGNERERRVLRKDEAVVPELQIDASVWQEACKLARRARRAGKTIPAPDVLICACARRHGVAIEHADVQAGSVASLSEPTERTTGDQGLICVDRDYLDVRFGDQSVWISEPVRAVSESSATLSFAALDSRPPRVRRQRQLGAGRGR